MSKDSGGMEDYRRPMGKGSVGKDCTFEDKTKGKQTRVEQVGQKRQRVRALDSERALCFTCGLI